MKDWKGHEVKVGDILVTVQVRETFEFFPSSMYMMSRDGKMELVKTFQRPDPMENLWEVKYEENVVELDTVFNGRKYHHIVRERIHSNGDIWTLPLDDPFTMNDEPDPNPSYIKCIKGKSDNRDEYYVNKFKA